MDQLYQRFVDLLVEARGLDRETALELADGRIYTAQEAPKHSFTDKIGYPEEAILHQRMRARSERESR